MDRLPSVFDVGVRVVSVLAFALIVSQFVLANIASRCGFVLTERKLLTVLQRIPLPH